MLLACCQSQLDTLGSDSLTVLSWDTVSPAFCDAECFQVAATLDIHSDALCGVAWSPNQQRLLTASADGTVGLWEEHSEP